MQRKTILLVYCLLSMVTMAQTGMSFTNLSIAPYAGNCKAAVSYTFDDGIQDQYTLAYPEMKRRGIRATFAIIGSKVGGVIKAKNTDPVPAMTWDQLRQLYADGFEIASHGWNHRGLPKLDEASLEQEVQKNDSAILAEIGHYPLTFVFPGNSKSDNVVAYVESTRVGSRTRQTSFGGKKDAAYMNAFVDNLLTSGSWGVTMTHGIATGYDHFQDPTQLYSHWDYVTTLQGQLWVAPFCEVAAYVKERDHATVSIHSENDKRIVLTISTTLDPTLFYQPLTLLVGSRVKAATQDGNNLMVVCRDEQAIIDGINPNGGAITIRKCNDK